MPAKPRKQASSRNALAQRNVSSIRNDTPAPRSKNGQWVAGFSGRQGTDPGRARKALNADTIRAMHDAFRRGGRQAIDKVMKNAPAQFLKMLVLLVPRELEVTHSGGVKGMSDEQLERGIEALEALMAKRAARPGDDAKVIEAQVAEPAAEEPSAPDP
jgi:hypothetical protein